MSLNDLWGQGIFFNSVVLWDVEENKLLKRN